MLEQTVNLPCKHTHINIHTKIHCRNGAVHISKHIDIARIISCGDLSSNHLSSRYRIKSQIFYIHYLFYIVWLLLMFVLLFIFFFSFLLLLFSRLCWEKKVVIADRNDLGVACLDQFEMIIRLLRLIKNDNSKFTI